MTEVFIIRRVFARPQTALYGQRFQLFDGRWYLDNLLREPYRYAPGLGTPGPGSLARVGLWSAAVGVPLSLGALLLKGMRGVRAARV